MASYRRSMTYFGLGAALVLLVLSPRMLNGPIEVTTATPDREWNIVVIAFHEFERERFSVDVAKAASQYAIREARPPFFAADMTYAKVNREAINPSYAWEPHRNFGAWRIVQV